LPPLRATRKIDGATTKRKTRTTTGGTVPEPRLAPPPAPAVVYGSRFGVAISDDACAGERIRSERGGEGLAVAGGPALPSLSRLV
jgi:hypothetical protein